MQSLEHIKKRIKSVETTSKITGTMKLIATANIRKQTKEFQKIASFCKDFYYVIKPLITVASEQPIIHKDNGKTLYILISSSLGLCGGFNISITKFLIERLKPDDRIIVIGKKGYAYLKSHGLSDKVIQCIEVSNKNLNYLEILPTSGLVMQLFNSEEYGQVKLIYTKFINSMTFNCSELKLLPLDATLFSDIESKQELRLMYDSINSKGQVIEYDSPKHQIYKSILPTFITTLIYAAIIESELCESGSRRNAMDTATKNAKELTSNLRLQFNRARQEKITQEINEIVAGGVSNE